MVTVYSVGEALSYREKRGHHATPAPYGPFRPYNNRGLPIVMKGIYPAWIAREIERKELTDER